MNQSRGHIVKSAIGHRSFQKIAFPVACFLTLLALSCFSELNASQVGNDPDGQQRTDATDANAHWNGASFMGMTIGDIKFADGAEVLVLCSQDGHSFSLEVADYPQRRQVSPVEVRWSFDEGPKTAFRPWLAATMDGGGTVFMGTTSCSGPPCVADPDVARLVRALRQHRLVTIEIEDRSHDQSLTKSIPLNGAADALSGCR
jgi:hypothetical protein